MTYCQSIGLIANMSLNSSPTMNDFNAGLCVRKDLKKKNNVY